MHSGATTSAEAIDEAHAFPLLAPIQRVCCVGAEVLGPVLVPLPVAVSVVAHVRIVRVIDGAL